VKSVGNEGELASIKSEVEKFCSTFLVPGLG